MKKATSLLLALFLMLGISEGVNAQFDLGKDDASNYTTSSYATEGNLGYGFGAWYTAIGTGSDGYFRGDASNSRSNAAILNTSSNSFGMYATDFVDIGRNFNALNIGDTLSFEFSIQWDNGNKGFDLYTGGVGTDQVFNFNYSTSGYVWDGGSQANTLWDSAPEDRQNGVVISCKFIQTSTGLDYEFKALSGDGTFTLKTGSDTFSGSINAIKFYVSGAGGGSGADFFFNKLSVSSPNANKELTGSAGYRLLSAPTTPTLSTLLDPVWTQATTGADTDQGSPNVFTWPTSATDGDSANWVGAIDLSTTLTAGTGVLVYVYDDTDYNGSGGDLPVTLSVTGTENGDVTGLTVNSNADGWTLVGNPFASTIDFDLTAKTDLTDVAYVWDPATSAWKSWTGSSGDLTDGLIDPFQGFFVQNASSVTSPDIDIELSDKTKNGSFYGKISSEKLSRIRLQLDGAGVTNSMWMQFSEEGSFESKVMGDALELEPLAFKFAKLSASKAGELMDIAHLPLNESFNLPLDVSSTESGEFTLKATDFALPAGMSVVFHDYQTGFEQEITEDFEYKFELGSEVAAKAVKPGNLVAGPLMAKSSGSDRFGIAIQPTGTSTENTDAPAEFALEQNYPNPFNPSTTIQYSVAEPGQVSLSVYNLMGQRVAELVNETKSAGTFNVSWNASNAASGMYYYRLVAGGKTITRKMTLIK